MSLAGCVGAPDSPGWPAVFADDIARLGGADIVDCGFLSLGLHGAPRSRLRAALACMTEAGQNGHAFKYGTVRVPMDSTAVEIYVRTTAGSYLFVRDEMVLQDFAQQWRQRCGSIQVEPRTGIIRAEQCVELGEVRA